ncbi:MAG: hypothetical protein IJ165_06195 [Proteobacteria bacterium]|nr:hypothetical protein [Pseudomonadota bacterium]
MRFCKTSIHFDQNNQQLNCSFGPDTTLSLNANGPTDAQNADVQLKLDNNGELAVLRNSDKPITLERAGRSRALTARQVRLCEGDTIRIENATLRITRSTFTAARPKLSATSRILAASAVFCSFALTACDDSCNPGETKCEDNAVYECKDNSWSLREKCDGALEPVCEMHDNKAICTPTRESGVMATPQCYENETKCEDNAVYECKAGEWQLKEQCDDECIEEDNEAACVTMSRTSGDLPAEPTPIPDK